MAPITEWIHAVLHHQQVITSDASFTEKALVLLVVGHILVLYTVLCWLGASTISGKPTSNERWSLKLRMPLPSTDDSRDPRKTECLEGQFELEPRESSKSNDEKHGPSPSALHI